MSLFDDIVKTVEKSETPGLESLTATEIGGISVNGDFDVDEDPMLGMAMEAMGKDVQYDADADPEAAGYSDKDIEKLSEAGAAEEDEDDDYSEETIGELLDGFVEAVYGDPEDEDPTDLLSEDDLDDIEDDLEEGMEGRLADEYEPDVFERDEQEDRYKAELKEAFPKKKLDKGLVGRSGNYKESIEDMRAGARRDEENEQRKKKEEEAKKLEKENRKASLPKRIKELEDKIERCKRDIPKYEKAVTKYTKELEEERKAYGGDSRSYITKSLLYENEEHLKRTKRVMNTYEKALEKLRAEASESFASIERGTPATESVENKKDLKSVKKRIKALEDELETNKKTCDTINASMKKLQKKSKRDVNALKDLVSFTASLGAQMVRQTAINAEIAQLKKEVIDYKNGVAQEKEEHREAKRAEQDVANIAKDYAGVTADYSDMVDEVKDLSEDVIEEVKEEEKAANNGKLGDRVKKFLSDFSNAWTEASANQGSMVSAMASYCLGDDIDMIAEESYIDIVKVYAQRDEAECDSTIDAINISIEAFEGYLGDNADDMGDLYPVYTSLLDMKAAFESVEESEKNIEKEIEILEKWVKLYGSQAVNNPSSFLEREIKSLKNRIATLKAKLEVPAAASATV